MGGGGGGTQLDDQLAHNLPYSRMAPFHGNVLCHRIFYFFSTKSFIHGLPGISAPTLWVTMFFKRQPILEHVLLYVTLDWLVVTLLVALWYVWPVLVPPLHTVPFSLTQ